MRALFLAAVTPDNTPHGYNWTFAFPMLLFIVTALVLWALFGRPHRRVPARRLGPGQGSRSSATLVASSGPSSAAGDGDGQAPAGNSGSGAAGATE